MKLAIFTPLAGLLASAGMAQAHGGHPEVTTPVQHDLAHLALGIGLALIIAAITASAVILKRRRARS